jgi:hypothetical protein
VWWKYDNGTGFWAFLDTNAGTTANRHIDLPTQEGTVLRNCLSVRSGSDLGFKSQKNFFFLSEFNMDQIEVIVEEQTETVELSLEQLAQVGGGTMGLLEL